MHVITPKDVKYLNLLPYTWYRVVDLMAIQNKNSWYNISRMFENSISVEIF
jgi:hypothetical protein